MSEHEESPRDAAPEPLITADERRALLEEDEESDVGDRWDAQS